MVINGTDFPIFHARPMACCEVVVEVFQSSRKSNSTGRVAGWGGGGRQGGGWVKGQMDLMVGLLQLNRAILDEHSVIAILS